MRYHVALLALIVLIVPMLVGCEITPQDKWPTITNWATTEDKKVVLTIDLTTLIPTLNLPPSGVDVIADVRTYHTNQYFTCIILTESWSRNKTVFVGGIPAGSVTNSWLGGPQFRKERVQGTYVCDSGKPPQGTTRLALGMCYPVPAGIQDWIGYHIEGGRPVLDYLGERYTYNLRYLLEDAEGRSDTFTFSFSIELELVIVGG